MAGTGDDGGGFFWGVILTLGGVWLYNSYVKEEADEPATVSAPAVRTPARPTGLIEVSVLEDGTIWRLNASAVSGPRTARQAWVVSDHKNNKKVAERETQTLYRLNCETGGYRVLKIVTYDAEGKSINAWGPELFSDKDDYVPPDTRMGSVIRAGCDPDFETPPAAPSATS